MCHVLFVSYRINRILVDFYNINVFVVCISVVTMYGTVGVVKNLRLVWKLSEKFPAFFLL
jgi:hypothetical protein